MSYENNRDRVKVILKISGISDTIYFKELIKNGYFEEAEIKLNENIVYFGNMWESDIFDEPQYFITYNKEWIGELSYSDLISIY